MLLKFISKATGPEELSAHYDVRYLGLLVVVENGKAWQLKSVSLLCSGERPAYPL